jgi:hypothetical protein
MVHISTKHNETQAGIQVVYPTELQLKCKHAWTKPTQCVQVVSVLAAVAAVLQVRASIWFNCDRCLTVLWYISIWY